MEEKGKFEEFLEKRIKVETKGGFVYRGTLIYADNHDLKLIDKKLGTMLLKADLVSRIEILRRGQ